jgi:hypothetical protein
LKGNPVGISIIAVAVLVNVIGIVWWVSAANHAPEGFWSEAAAAWFQGIATIDALALAILVPAWQHDRDQAIKQQERDCFADAFGLVLLPQIKAHAARLEHDIGRNRIAVDGDSKSNFVFWTDADGPNCYSFVLENWEAVARCSPRLIGEMVSFAKAIEDAADRYSHEHDVWVLPRDHEPDEVEISLGSRERFNAYIQDLSAAAASLRRAEAIIEG